MYKRLKLLIQLWKQNPLEPIGDLGDCKEGPFRIRELGKKWQSVLRKASISIKELGETRELKIINQSNRFQGVREPIFPRPLYWTSTERCCIIFS